MTEDHERIEELLAGHALGALDGEDRAEADRLLAEHVPTCLRCRTTLDPFLDVAGDLALAAPAAQPPDLLWGRLKRDVLAPPAPRRRRVFAWGSVVTAAAAVVGLAAWNATLNTRLSNEVASQRQLSNAITTLADPNSTKVRLDSDTEPNPMEAAYVTRQAHLSIVGVGIPDPAPGQVYRLWLVGSQGNRLARDFRPDHGVVVLTVSVDPSRYSELVITEEHAGRPGNGPGGRLRWSSGL